MEIIFDAIARWSQHAMTATEYTALALFVLTGLLLLLTYVIARQDRAEVAAWLALGCVAAAIHFMVVGWREIAVHKLGLVQNAAAMPADGSRFRDCPDCPEMVVIPTGYFVMGADDAIAAPEEGPLRRMMIAKRFAISREAISSAELDRFFAAAGTPLCAAALAGCLDWRDAQAYAGWLSGKTSKAYRLPSAAEWEYAARAGAAPPTAKEAGGSLVKASLTGPAGPIMANSFGVAGLTRDTVEFVEDCWSFNLSALASTGRALLAPRGTSCPFRVAKIARAGAPPRFSGRLPVHMEAAQTRVGFRVVRELN